MNIVFIVVCQFPHGRASSMRARNIYKLLEEAGHSVHVISDAASDKEIENGNEFSCEAVYKECKSFKERQLVAKKSVEALIRYCKQNKVDAVLTNARYDRFNKLASFCRKKKIRLFVENCEWYDKSSFKLGRLDIRFWRNEKMLRADFKKAEGFISISRFLDEHNKKFARSVRIPTILDVKNTAFSLETKNEKIKIVYTGMPGKNKEFLAPLCKALAENKSLREKIEFHIYGPSYGAVVKNIGDEKILKDAGKSVTVHGRVPQEEIEGILTCADYLIFLRPKRRSSNAGFPTKLGESFAVGTPVIANDTGDLGLYIKNGENGFLMKGTEEEEIQKVLEKICLLEKTEYENIRQNARKTAEECFDFRGYKEEIKELLK